MNGQNSVIKHLYNYTDIPDKIGQKEYETVFKLAITNCNVEIIEIVTKNCQHCDVNVGLIIACKEGQLSKPLVEYTVCPAVRLCES